MTGSVILNRAKQIIADPANWVQGRFAEDAIGIPCSPVSKIACRFCAIGAVRHVAIGHFQKHKLRALGMLVRAATVVGASHVPQKAIKGIEELNDCDVDDTGKVHGYVMEAFDLAIDMALAEESK